MEQRTGETVVCHHHCMRKNHQHHHKHLLPDRVVGLTGWIRGLMGTERDSIFLPLPDDITNQNNEDDSKLHEQQKRWPIELCTFPKRGVYLNPSPPPKHTQKTLNDNGRRANIVYAGMTETPARCRVAFPSCPTHKIPDPKESIKQSIANTEFLGKERYPSELCIVQFAMPAFNSFPSGAYFNMCMLQTKHTKFKLQPYRIVEPARL